MRDTLISYLTGALARAFPSQPHDRLDPPPRRIVLIKPCCLGDVLMATATFRALREAFPQAVIHLAVGPAAVAVVKGNPRLDALLDLGPLGTDQTGLCALMVASRRLRARGYDTAITLDRSPIVGSLAWLAGIPRRVGLDSGGRGFAQTVRIPAAPSLRRHEAEVYLDTLRAIGIEPIAPQLEYSPQQRRGTGDRGLEGRDWRLEIEAPSLQSLVLLHPAGGVNPGMTMVAKRWPAERFARLADRLIDEQGATVALVGGPRDHDVSAAVRALARRPLPDLTGRLSWDALGALARQAALYIGNDTGATHLAVAVGVPTLMIMGPTDPLRYGPYRPTAPHTVAAVTPPDAQPDDYLALRHVATRDNPRLSMETISVEQAYEAALRLLGMRDGE